MIEQPEAILLEEASRALRAGDDTRARLLLRDVLRSNPNNPRAWQLAYAASRTERERATCLKRWLALEPEHPEARRLAVATSPDPFPAPPPVSPPRRFGDLLAAPFAWLFHISPQAILLVGLLLLGIGGWFYLRSNTGAWGMSLNGEATLAESCEGMATDAPCWKVLYERAGVSTFAGKVRHTSVIRQRQFPMLSHDILVTSGDFADPDKVRTSVANHRFVWRSRNEAYPQGRINLLHTVPASEAIHQQLREIRSGQEVIIEGREILKIDVYTADGTYKGTWQDAGCNTLVVTAVTIVDGAP